MVSENKNHGKNHSFFMMTIAATKNAATTKVVTASINLKPITQNSLLSKESL